MPAAILRPLTASVLCVLFLVSSVPAGSSTHGDGAYDIPVWFTWNRAQLDVLVIPPEHGQVYNGNGVLDGGDPFEATPFNSYLQAVKDSINDWQRAIDTYGPVWLRGNLDIDVYVIGEDFDIPPGDIVNYDIVVLSDQTKANILGVAVRSNDRCYVDNSKFFVTSFTYEDMYNINGQEYGHCLGLNHVDGGDPTFDVMNGFYPQSPGSANNVKQCPSNLDVKGLERVFGGLFGQPSGGTATMSTSAYETIPC